MNNRRWDDSIQLTDEEIDRIAAAGRIAMDLFVKSMPHPKMPKPDRDIGLFQMRSMIRVEFCAADFCVTVHA